MKSDLVENQTVYKPFEKQIVLLNYLTNNEMRRKNLFTNCKFDHADFKDTLPIEMYTIIFDYLIRLLAIDFVSNFSNSRVGCPPHFKIWSKKKFLSEEEIL